MRIVLTIGIAIGILGLVNGTVMAQSGNELFQQALVKERTEGNMAEAIKLYQTIVQRYGTDRKLVARALVQMAECYEKLGQRDARTAYERVVGEFADQAESAATARTRLIALTRAGDAGTGIAVRRVWEDVPLDAARKAAISPDGRYLVYQGGGGPNRRSALYVRDLLAGLNRRLTLDSATNMTYVPVFSPDGKQVAFGWDNGMGPKLLLIALDGSAPRVLHQSEEWGFLSPRDWSADGMQILALGRRNPLTSDSQTHIVLVSVADGSVRELRTITYNDNDWPSRMSLSLDGRYLVYDARGGSTERDIFILSTGGGQEARIVTRATEDRYPAFTPDGMGVLFLSRETAGTTAAWYQRVVDGKPQGSPELLRPDMGNSPIPIGFTQNGSFYYSYSEESTMKLFAATLDPASGTIADQPAQVTQRSVSRSAGWSPNGQYLAYQSQRPAAQGEFGAFLTRAGWTRSIIVIHSQTGEEREFATALSIVGASGWSPNSRFLLVWGTDKERRDGFYRLNVETGDVALLFYDEKPGWNSTNEHWFPNEESIVYIRQESGGESIVSRDLETGRETELYRPPAPLLLGPSLKVSADGRHMAAYVRNPEARTMSVLIITATGEKPRELGPPVRYPERIDGIWALTPDGRQVLYTTYDQESAIRGHKVWRVAVAGGAPQEIRLPTEMLDSVGTVSFHPDGQRIAFGSSGPGKTSVNVMENFLPKTGAAR